MVFCSGSVCDSGPVVCSWPWCVVWFRPPGLFQKRRRPRATQRPGFPTLEGDDPRTDLLTGTAFYATCLGGIAGVVGHRMAVLAYRLPPVLSRSPSRFPSFPSSSCRFDKNAARDWASDVVPHRRCWLGLASTFHRLSYLGSSLFLIFPTALSGFSVEVPPCRAIGSKLTRFSEVLKTGVAEQVPICSVHRVRFSVASRNEFHRSSEVLKTMEVPHRSR